MHNCKLLLIVGLLTFAKKKLTLQTRVNMFKYHTQKMEMYYGKVVEMHQKGCTPSTISKKINLDPDTIRRWIRIFASDCKLINIVNKVAFVT